MATIIFAVALATGGTPVSAKETYDEAVAAEAWGSGDNPDYGQWGE